MSKSQDSKRESKKPATHTAKEKKDAKRQKKADKAHHHLLSNL